MRTLQALDAWGSEHPLLATFAMLLAIDAYFAMSRNR